MPRWVPNGDEVGTVEVVVTTTATIELTSVLGAANTQLTAVVYPGRVERVREHISMEIRQTVVSKILSARGRGLMTTNVQTISTSLVQTALTALQTTGSSQVKDAGGPCAISFLVRMWTLLLLLVDGWTKPTEGS